MLSKKPTPVSKPPAVDPRAVAERETGIVLDTLGALLRAYGRDAFDIGKRQAADVDALVNAWALHATIGAPRPNHPDDRLGLPLLDRDWKSLIQGFSEIRREERHAVVTSVADLRAVVQAFISAARSLAIEEDEAHRSTAAVLERVRWATTADDTELLRREAVNAVESIYTLLRIRREQQQARFATLAESVRTLGQELEVAKTQAITDPLTGLANRKGFELEINRAIELHAMLNKPASLLMVDIDYFKAVNDSYGHQAGDAVLREVARALARTFLRRCDVVSRLGGDEFAVILPETAGDGAARLAERLRQAVNSVHDAVPQMEMPPTLSIGIAELVLGDDAERWIARADQALYVAKQAGRDQIQLATVPAETDVAA